MPMNIKSLLTAIVLLTALGLPAQANTSATFYANRLVGRVMANGQRYYHGNRTAAHPSLPLGIRVKVTNLSNNRSVIVKITDRCNCGIDLSRSAFEAIANTQKGRVNVSIQRL